MSLDAFSQQYRQRIDALLQQHIDDLSDVAPTLKAAMRHGLLLGGKRVRPFLVYATGNMLGVADELLDGPAAAIECIHAYSLIHDDLPVWTTTTCGGESPPTTRYTARRWRYWQATPCSRRRSG